jgi:hypothetical protein
MFIPIAARHRHISTQTTTSHYHKYTIWVAVMRGKNGAMHSNLSEEEEPSIHGFGEVNKYTSGTGFYGPTATLAFLIKLRSRARSFQTKSTQLNSKTSTPVSNLRRSRRPSIVNFFHGDDHIESGTRPLQLSELEVIIILLLISSHERIQINHLRTTNMISPSKPGSFRAFARFITCFASAGTKCRNRKGMYPITLCEPAFDLPLSRQSVFYSPM